MAAMSNKIRNMDFGKLKKEYSLVKVKKSKLPYKNRAEVVERYETLIALAYLKKEGVDLCRK